MYLNNILNFQESTTILNSCIKMSGNLLKAPRIYIYIYISQYLLFYNTQNVSHYFLLIVSVHL